MKRFTMFAALVLMMALPMFAERVTPETARKVATTFLNNNGAKTSQLIDLSKAAGFPNLYIFSTENSFVVMSADDCAKPVLGYSLTDEFIVEGMPENLRWWLQEYSDEIQWAVERGIQSDQTTMTEWQNLKEGKASKDSPVVVVGPLLTTAWNQGYPYNNLCPITNSTTGDRAPTGCVATAMAQIMKFWNYPSRGIGFHDYKYGNYGTIRADFGATTYDWNNMTNTYSSSSLDIQNAAVATLMYHCGVSVEMKYGPNESGSTIKRSSIGMNTYFNYSTTYIEKKNFADQQKWIDTLKYELNHSRPILYAGSGALGGHAFVCDGYNSDGKFHFNWGWGGSYNDSYFTVDAITPGSYNFSSEQSAVINIKPLTDTNLPLVMALNQPEGIINLNWTDSQNSTSYNIYRNNALIANTNEMTYLDIEPEYGFNVYYVRGMKNDTLSLPSNCESIAINYPTPIVSDLNVGVTDNSASLSWEAPEWCYPSVADEETFSYVDEERLNNRDPYYSWNEGSFVLSWGHRYPTENLVGYNGKAIHEISFFSMYPGAFDVVVYQGTENNKPVEEIARKSITTARIGWSRVDFNTPAIIDASKDLWIFIINTDFKVHTIYYKEVSNNENGGYYTGADPTLGYNSIDNPNITWLISTYLTDGVYTYNLYDNGTKVNGDTSISDTSYTISNVVADSIHQYTVKTNYYGGESEASNKASLAVGTTSLEYLNLGDSDMMTIVSNSTLTVNGTLANTNPEHLVLEDGAQLVNGSNGVAATVKKNIAAWTTGTPVGGWYFIASPINSAELAPDSVVNMLTDANEDGDLTYDLYSYNANEAKPWINYRQHIDEDGFVIANGMGYLYANAADQTLEFSGEIKPYNTFANIVTLTNDGWNLIGNPFTCAVTVSEPFSELNNGFSVTNKAAGDTINPCAGIAVYGNANDVVTFTKLATQNAMQSPGNLRITLEQQAIIRDGFDVTTIDNAIVSFSESASLPKFTLLGTNSKLYIPQGDEEYAIVSAEALGEMPLNFHANENGQYTITVNPENVEMDYLHLIDNLTGNDVDLLSTPSYSFEAKTNDYESRFRLVFFAREDADGDSETFAFVNNGQIIITGMGDACNASLQIVDLTGRIVFCGDAARGISTTEMPAGIYVLRLITAGDVKTQKIIID